MDSIKILSQADFLLPIIVAVCLVYIFSAFTKRSKDSIPHVRGWPIFGSASKVFSCPSMFALTNRQRHGSKFYCKVMNSDWLFLCDPLDIKIVCSASEKAVSLLDGYRDLAGFVLPLDKNLNTYPTEVRAKLDNWTTSASPHIAFSVRPNVIKGWISIVRKVVRDTLADLPDGTDQRVDLFDYCRIAISGVTTMLMMGEDAFQNATFLKKWINLFAEADVEKGFSDPTSALTTLLEVIIFGERRIYQRIRALLYPMIDKEIEDIIAGKETTTDHPSAMASIVRFRYEREFNKNADFLRLARTRIANDIFSFSFAAFSNSFGGAAWVLYHILKDTQGTGTRVRDDIASSSPNEIPQSLHNCVLEVTRLYNPGNMIRKVKQPLTLADGTIVQPGVTLAVNTFIIGRTGYDNPLRFDPDRFARGEHKENCFLGFGMGSHPCVGKNFAMLEICVLVQECLAFGFQLAPREVEMREPLMDECIDIMDHPNLTPNQSTFLWRPSKPVFLLYDK